MPIWEFPFNFDFIQRPDWIKPGTRVVNELDLGAALTGELKLDPPLMSVFIHNSNPVSQQQNANKLIKGLKREDLFTVVSEQFITDTARYADILLPATMQAEQYDLAVTWGHLYVMLNQPAISPPGECVPNIEMFRRLAKTMGFNDDYWSMTDDELLMKMYDWSSPALKGISLEKLKEVGWMRLNVGAPDKRAPHAQGNFKTPRANASSRPAQLKGETSSCRSGAMVTTKSSPVPRSIRAGLHSAEGGLRRRCGACQALSDQPDFSQATRLPELAICERGGSTAATRRADDCHSPEGRRQPKHQEWRLHTRLQ